MWCPRLGQKGPAISAPVVLASAEPPAGQHEAAAVDVAAGPARMPSTAHQPCREEEQVVLHYHQQLKAYGPCKHRL